MRLLLSDFLFILIYVPICLLELVSHCLRGWFMVILLYLEPSFSVERLRDNYSKSDVQSMCLR